MKTKKKGYSYNNGEILVLLKEGEVGRFLEGLVES